jgi:hypothetical protein
LSHRDESGYLLITYTRPFCVCSETTKKIRSCQFIIATTKTHSGDILHEFTQPDSDRTQTGSSLSGEPRLNQLIWGMSHRLLLSDGVTPRLVLMDGVLEKSDLVGVGKSEPLMGTFRRSRRVKKSFVTKERID